MSARRPRNRYVAFRVEGSRAFRREEVLEALRSAVPTVWLLEFDGVRGLVRTTNLEKDATIAALNQVGSIAGEPARVVTIGTSGTIRRASRKYLAKRAPPSAKAGNKPFK